MTRQQETKQELNEQMVSVAKTIMTATAGLRRDVVAIAAVNVLLNMALQGFGGNRDEAEKYTRQIVDLAISGMHRNGGALQ